MVAESNLAAQDFQIDTEGRQRSQLARHSGSSEREKRERLSLLSLNE